MNRLVAIDLPGGPGFVDELQRVWDAGDAAFPVDQRLPGDAKRELCAAMRVGDEVEPGDALVVATVEEILAVARAAEPKLRALIRAAVQAAA